MYRHSLLYTLPFSFPLPVLKSWCVTSRERRKGHTMTVVQVALKKLTLSQECLSGQLELGLPWDPLAQSVTAIETCRRNLQRLSTWSDKGDKAEHLDIRSRALSYSGETFCKKNLQGDKQSKHNDDMCLKTNYFCLHECKPLRKRKDCSSSRFSGKAQKK